MPDAIFDWPVSRFKRASKYYINELTFILSSNYDENCSTSQIRMSLGDVIGRIIRFYLRRFFNPIPVSLHSYSNAKQPDYDFSRSCVHSIVEMSQIEGQRDTAVADGSISSVVSLALLHINEFYDLCSCINSNMNSENKYINSFCSRPGSTKGFGKKQLKLTLNENDLEDILLDISESHIVLSGIRACKFFHALMKWPGVSEAIDDIGGWSKVEHFSKIFAEFQLEKEAPDEMHFKLLRDVEGLIRRIDTDLDELQELEKECDNSLRCLWKRFKCGTRKQDVLKSNPEIVVIKKHLKTGGDTFFPSIVDVQD